MAGYANRVIKKSFPELAEDGDYIEIIIRNPKTVPPEDLRRSAPGLAVGPDGEATDTDAAAKAGYAVMAKLVIGWHVYDASAYDPENPDADQPLLPLPATAESIGKLPLEILMWLGDEMGKATPGQKTASPADGTSTPS